MASLFRLSMHGLSSIRPSAIKLSSVSLSSTFSVERAEDGDDASSPLLAPALTRFATLVH
jgi:hypothetical protein